MSTSVEWGDADCAVPGCEEVTVGHESPVMPGLTEDGELVRVTLQWCPKHAVGFDLVLAGFTDNLPELPRRRHGAVERRLGYSQAVEGFISA
ncbi:hypothetical protein [uncultured Friedmanniella sp.]|uniref:hypothetical protein n=1 Tax=uncultured Friedmanniella sp. TaxID=335381 RepID=UPI0035CB561E